MVGVRGKESLSGLYIAAIWKDNYSPDALQQQAIATGVHI